MDDLMPIKAIIDNHRRAFPDHRRYPKKVWDKIIPLAEKYDVKTLAKGLSICPNNLRKKIKNNNLPRPIATNNSSFVEVPNINVGTQVITLELPHNIRLKIEL